MITVVLGATDRGKTTTLAQLVREAARTDERVAVIDADTGQSEIGPPGTVGLAWARADTEKLSELKPAATYFVGALTPQSAALEHVVAVTQAVRHAYQRGATQVFVDTPGYVVGPGARRFLVSLVQATAPQRLFVIERDGELGSLVAALAAGSGATVDRLLPSESVVRKSSSVRATRRLARFAKIVAEPRTLAVPLGAVATVGATLGTGQRVALPVVQWASDVLRLPLVWGELSDGVLALFTDGPLPRPGWESLTGPILQQASARSVKLLSLALHLGVLIGLHDESGALVSVGRFLGLDPEREEILLSAAAPASVERTALIAFGRFRLGADGVVTGEVRPGEL